jgi:hypothetical protein
MSSSPTLNHATLQRASGEQAGFYLFADGVMVFVPLPAETAYALVKREVKSGLTRLANDLKNLIPAKRLTVKEEYIVAVRAANGRWNYGFGDLELGDQLHCPLQPDETPAKAQARVGSAVCSWRSRGDGERRSMEFSTAQRNGYILVERTK